MAALTADSLVWAKVRGYPWWPGRIKALNEIPRELAETARQTSKREAVQPVYFFGSHDYALVAADSLKPLAEDWDTLSLKTHGSKFKMALVEASILLGKGGVLEAPATEEREYEATSRIDGDFDEKDLPTNAFIEIDPETGEKTIKKRRGRPPKRRPEDLPAIQYKIKAKTRTKVKEKKAAKVPKVKEGKKTKKHLKLLKDSKVKKHRKTLQKILLRPTLKAREISIAQDIIRILFVKRRCSVEQLDKTKLGYVLVQAMKRKVWAPYPEMMKSFKAVLSNWKSLP